MEAELKSGKKERKKVSNLSVFIPAQYFPLYSKRFKQTLIYFDMDTQYANFQGNPFVKPKTVLNR